MTTPIIEAHGLTKRFSRGKTTVDAVTDVTFDVDAGSLVAFLGPNGAGKSTTIRMLTTLIPPTSGGARVVGHDIAGAPHEVRARIGYVGQGTSGSFAQRVRDELISQGAFYGVGKAQSRRRADELIESLDLASFGSRTVQQLSGGQKRRLDIALGLMHAPTLLCLDEPSTGLDPQSRANLWQHILDLRERYGTTVFLTTHYLDEADHYAERVMVMDGGRVIADDSAAALKATLAGDAVSLGFASAADADAALAHVARLAGREVTRADALTLTTNVADGERLLPRVIRDLDAQGIAVERATGVPPTLDDVFLALTGRSLRDADAGTPDPGADADATLTTTAGEPS
ncbi:ABC transporter ATP-binding protein [Demequina sp. NBRC 110057]|uniref:ABC transporter ATP-binding protein n=1 Tax=Demequina sp. NBRC 110057 TaxID=1570346 RepID=UPI00190ED8E2|nr:ABC transporter ATP-binding protein [Demequina sp. NBRC 110057]